MQVCTMIQQGAGPNLAAISTLSKMTQPKIQVRVISLGESLRTTNLDTYPDRDITLISVHQSAFCPCFAGARKRLCKQI